MNLSQRYGEYIDQIHLEDLIIDALVLDQYFEYFMETLTLDELLEVEYFIEQVYDLWVVADKLEELYKRS